MKKIIIYTMAAREAIRGRRQLVFYFAMKKAKLLKNTLNIWEITSPIMKLSIKL